MSDDDPLRTRRDIGTPLAAELDAAGFEDAVEIGRGGFGVVYRCWQSELDRTVAVKVLNAEGDADDRARFLREQRAMGRLTGHPNVVTVLEVGTTASGRPYLVMPYHPLNSLDVWIREHGPLGVEQALEMGDRIAGALAEAHRLGIVHRDVKPGNILLTEHGDAALTDFGIAHFAGGFQTSAGTLTGSPAFTAPEVLEGGTPTQAADVYGLGATLFAALTGHAAFERRSGENMVTQFVRITTQPVPDLRETGIPAQVSALVQAAMDRDPHKRPTAAALGQSLRRVQQQLRSVPGQTTPRADPARYRTLEAEKRRPWAASAVPVDGNLPLELSSFVNRRTELSELKNLLSGNRLVTLSGIGGVGKTRLALRAASQVQADYADGVWLIEMADVTDAAGVAGVVAATLGFHDAAARLLPEALAQILAAQETLLVLDNCEQVVGSVAELTEMLLRACPKLRILATSREPLNIAGEAVLRLMPLPIPDPVREPALAAMPRFDAVMLFTDRAAAAARGFQLDDQNKVAVARICARLDGLPLAIELAAARTRTMTPPQILERLTDRYTLLTRGSRTAPSRQQTMKCCIDWSYELCTPVEQRMWARVSVFAGSFELEAAVGICGTGLTTGLSADVGECSPLDVLSSLVDKSILVAEETNHAVRFRMLETIRDYGREKLRESGEDNDLRRRHRDWYHALVLAAEAGWISDQQPEWIDRLACELPNLREAVEACRSVDAAETGLRIAAGLYQFWSFRGLYGEARSWLNNVLGHAKAASAPDRVRALCVGCEMAAAQGDFDAAAVLFAEARVIADRAPTPAIQAQITYTTGFFALARGEVTDALAFLARAVEMLGSNKTAASYISAVTILAWAYELCGDTTRASEYYRKVASITEERGELLYRSVALRGMAVGAWREGAGDRARRLLEQALRVNRRTRSQLVTTFGLETLAWIVADEGNAERAAVLIGAAQRRWLLGSSAGSVFPNMAHEHEKCERMARRTLGVRRFEAAFRKGEAMSADAAVSYALGEQQPADALAAGPSATLTKRERQVAGLVAQGLTNKQIAAELVISQRTAQGHVEHILTKLGFNSRTQIAAWIVAESQQSGV
ncbi:protein kinase domain-containing protein [Nocardia sp. CA-120079]|uniref:protein kinase domain-containing protein n=1 Tax=Nocardia sp. CA-120079 TaxID=3239974 RepID=UPI003D953BC7